MLESCEPEHSYTASKNNNWSSHARKQYGSVQENRVFLCFMTQWFIPGDFINKMT